MNDLRGYYFIFKQGTDEELLLPLSPSEFKTKVGNKNKTTETVGLGEINIIKDIGLREFSFKICLPKDNQLTNINTDYFSKPIIYLNKFREYKKSKKPLYLIIIRILPNGERIFNGNVKVTFEDYNVEENAGEEGDFWVDIKLKEYRQISAIYNNILGVNSNTGNTEVEQIVERVSKRTAKTYVVKEGDSLWSIAKIQLNDGSRHSEIANLNGIKDFNSLQTGMNLALP